MIMARVPLSSLLCKVDGCEGKYFACGLCRKHYSQKWRYGVIFEDRPRGGHTTNYEPTQTQWERSIELLEAELTIEIDSYDNTVGLRMRMRRAGRIRMLRDTLREVRRQFEEFKAKKKPGPNGAPVAKNSAIRSHDP